ncbi:DUF3011 domain-containing protein [Stenotrophomonas sp.]|uniref:DUF3011 domain-containing protein n=1 Tax=Stenotrophomonas sp. TaxID=69392 RepID=UPI0028AAD894|nr:DUF3011 domain-containing protein [Stenotrophomonas sp.]
MGTRAYAPENLSQLSSNDRARVISEEYADQSNGRRIPDDQLRFYLAQVNSGWGFSRIKQDIATSLGGSGSGGGWNGGGGGGNNGTVRCESQDNRQRVCTTGWRSARLSRQISGTRCVEGSNWGSRNGQVWVSGGCRAEFAEGRGGSIGGPGGSGGTIRCESQDNRERTCSTGWRNATLVRQISGTACVEGQTWGVRNGAIWVNRGCRGEFAESRGNWGGGGGNSNYSVTCSSNDKRQQTCAWDSRQGRPVVVQQLSGTACVEGRSWGYRNGTLWVSGGCRARFGAR